MAQVPTNGLIGYWPFNGNANDESGNGNNGIVRGATLTADRFGNANSAYTFIDTCNIDCGNASSLGLTTSNTVTISYWTKSSVSAFPFISKYQSYAASNSNYFVGAAATGISNSVRITGNGQNNYDYSVIPSQWNYVCVIFEGTIDSALVYINGIYIDKKYLNYSTQISTQSLIFGPRVYTSYPQSNGQLDDIRIYNRALNSDEINTLYHEDGWLGMNEFTTENAFSVYPDPANDNITIESTSLNNIKDEIISIYNIQGQLLMQQPMLKLINNIDILSLESGLYIIKIKTKNRVVIKKFIKE